MVCAEGILEWIHYFCKIRFLSNLFYYYFIAKTVRFQTSKKEKT
jgi:hypothetical protein